MTLAKSRISVHILNFGIQDRGKSFIDWFICLFFGDRSIIANILEITYQSGGSDRCWSGSHCFIWIRSRIGTQILLVSLISFGLLKNKNNFFLKFSSFYITYGTGTWLMLLTYCLRITTGGRTNLNFNIKLLDKFLLRIREKKVRISPSVSDPHKFSCGSGSRIP